jgi:hypothetical protein
MVRITVGQLGTWPEAHFAPVARGMAGEPCRKADLNDRFAK